MRIRWGGHARHAGDPDERILSSDARQEPPREAAESEWSSELITKTSMEREVRVRLSTDELTVKYKAGLVARTVFVDGVAMARILRWKRLEDGTMYDEAELELRDGDRTRPCRVLVYGSTEITGMSLFVDDRLLYEEPRPA